MSGATLARDTILLWVSWRCGIALGYRLGAVATFQSLRLLELITSSPISVALQETVRLCRTYGNHSKNCRAPHSAEHG